MKKQRARVSWDQRRCGSRRENREAQKSIDTAGWRQKGGGEGRKKKIRSDLGHRRRKGKESLKLLYSPNQTLSLMTQTSRCTSRSNRLRTPTRKLPLPPLLLRK